MKVCPKCGAGFSDEVKFCTKCGTMLVPDEIQPEEPYRNGRQEDPYGNDRQRDSYGNDRQRDSYGNDRQREPYRDDRQREPYRDDRQRESYGNSRQGDRYSDGRQESRYQDDWTDDRQQERQYRGEQYQDDRNRGYSGGGNHHKDDRKLLITLIIVLTIVAAAGLGFVIYFVFGSSKGKDRTAATTTPAPTATAAPTATPTPAATDTPTPAATATPTPKATATPTPTPKATATPTPTATPAAAFPDQSGHTYKIVMKDCTWDEALADAAANGGQLAAFEDPAEYQQVTSVLNRAGDTSMVLWVGAKRDPSSQSYYWVDASGNPETQAAVNSAAYASMWLSGEPTFMDDSGNRETCVNMFYVSSAGNWMLNDAPDNELAAAPDYAGKIGYVIEYKG